MGFSDALQSLTGTQIFLCMFLSLCTTGDGDGRISSTPMKKKTVKCLDSALMKIREDLKMGITTSFERAWLKIKSNSQLFTHVTPAFDFVLLALMQRRRRVLLGTGCPPKAIQRPYLQFSLLVFQTWFQRRFLQPLFCLFQPYSEYWALLKWLAFALLW